MNKYNNQLDSLRRYLKELIEGLDFVEWGSEFQRREAEGTKEWREADEREKGTIRLPNMVGITGDSNELLVSDKVLPD